MKPRSYRWDVEIGYAEYRHLFRSTGRVPTGTGCDNYPMILPLNPETRASADNLEPRCLGSLSVSEDLTRTNTSWNSSIVDPHTTLGPGKGGPCDYFNFHLCFTCQSLCVAANAVLASLRDL